MNWTMVEDGLPEIGAKAIFRVLIGTSSYFFYGERGGMDNLYFVSNWDGSPSQAGYAYNISSIEWKFVTHWMQLFPNSSRWNKQESLPDLPETGV